MTTDAQTVIDTLRASHDRLVEISGQISDDQLTGRAYPSEWNIAQVFSHLGSGAQIMGMYLEAALTGAEPPARTAFPPIWDVWNAKSPQLQRADALGSDAALLERLEETTAEQRATVTFALWGAPSDIANLANTRLAEHAVHTWDIAVARDPAATILPAAVGLLMGGSAGLDGPVGRVVMRSAKPGPWQGRIRVVTTDPSRRFALTLGDQASLTVLDGESSDAEAAESGAFDADLVLPAQAWIRLVFGRLDPAHTPPANPPGNVQATGVTLDDLRASFQGF
jgi:hypothetical protein